MEGTSNITYAIKYRARAVLYADGERWMSLRRASECFNERLFQRLTVAKPMMLRKHRKIRVSIKISKILNLPCIANIGSNTAGHEIALLRVRRIYLSRKLKRYNSRRMGIRLYRSSERKKSSTKDYAPEIDLSHKFMVLLSDCIEMNSRNNVGSALLGFSHA